MNERRVCDYLETVFPNIGDVLRPNNTENFKARIRTEVKLIRPETLSEVLEEFRNGYCFEVNSINFEQVIYFINDLNSYEFISPFI